MKYYKFETIDNVVPLYIRFPSVIHYMNTLV